MSFIRFFTITYAQAILLLLLASMPSTHAFAGELRMSSSLAQIQTSVGNIDIELYTEQAPITTANFIRYIQAQAFSGGSFYRVVRKDNDNGKPIIQVIQGSANRDFKDFPAIALETTQDTGIKHLNGTLSMARGEPTSATHEFFICIGSQPSLDFGGMRNPDGQGFAAFGRVIKGMDVVQAIHSIREAAVVEDAYVKGQILAKPVQINSVLLLGQQSISE